MHGGWAASVSVFAGVVPACHGFYTHCQFIITWFTWGRPGKLLPFGGFVLLLVAALKYVVCCVDQ
jgi:hypothetical protein